MSDFEYLNRSVVKHFIRENIQSDLRKLVLNPPAEFRDHIKEIVDQIQARRKAKGKLDTWVDNPELIFPPPLSVEQSSSEKAANYKKTIMSGKHLIDLTGGMGIDCLALGEQFEQVAYVEQQAELTAIFKYNARKLGKEVKTLASEATNFLEHLDTNQREYTSFFIDPARRNMHKNKVFQLADCSPNLIEIMPLLQQKGLQVLVKLSPIIDLKATLAQVDHVREVHVVSIKNECKEVLLWIDFEFSNEPLIKTINLTEVDQTFDFKLSQENASIVSLGVEQNYLLEPNASILKAGAFKQIAARFPVNKLHSNTHLYTTDQEVAKWPGRTFKIEASDVDKTVLQQYTKNGSINVLTRNYPVSANDLKKKYKLKDGGDFFLIGFTNQKEKVRLVIARKIG